MAEWLTQLMHCEKNTNSMSEFAAQVKKVVKGIPKGETLSYQEVAAKAGNARAARAVANIMAANFDPDIPCHRVIKHDGSLGGYNRGGEAKKRAILKAEGAL